MAIIDGKSFSLTNHKGAAYFIILFLPYSELHSGWDNYVWKTTNPDVW